jgi:hypothetical protein
LSQTQPSTRKTRKSHPRIGSRICATYSLTARNKNQSSNHARADLCTLKLYPNKE